MFEKLNGKIEMSKEEYYEMCDEYKDLQKENSWLEKEIEELEEKKSTQVLNNNILLGEHKEMTLTIDNRIYCLKEVTMQEDKITFITKDYITDKYTIDFINKNYKLMVEYTESGDKRMRYYHYQQIAKMLCLDCNRFTIVVNK